MLRVLLLPVRRLRRAGFRGFVLTLAAIYLFAMYAMQSDLKTPPRPEVDEQPEAPDRQRRWVDVGADAADRRPRVDGDDGERQAVFDDFRKLDQQQQPEVVMRANRQPDVAHPGRPNPEAAIRRDRNRFVAERDTNVPDGCPPETEADGSFQQPVDSVFVLSAFWDERPNDFDNQHNGSFIRIMAIVRGPSRPPMACVFDDHPDINGRRPAQVEIRYYEMCENHGRPYGSFILSCLVPTTVRRAPCRIAVGSSSGGAVTDRVQVPIRTLRPATGAEPYEFAVCVPPLFGLVSTGRLIEFFEVTFLLGADRIVLYDYNVPEQIRHIVEYYAARCQQQQQPPHPGNTRRPCRVDLIRWPLPSDVDNGIWYHGQSISLQDCLYRQMASSRHVVFSDIDEFVVPHAAGAHDWSEMVSRLERPGRCALQLNSAFFDPGPDRPPEARSSDQPDRKSVSERYRLGTTTALRRSGFSTVRTKCVVRPYEIFEAGIHHVSKPIWADLEVYRVDVEDAYLHHYRSCVGNMGMDCRGVVDDTTMLRYQERIETAVLTAYRELAGVLMEL